MEPLLLACLPLRLPACVFAAAAVPRCSYRILGPQANRVAYPNRRQKSSRSALRDPPRLYPDAAISAAKHANHAASEDAAPASRADYPAGGFVRIVGLRLHGASLLPSAGRPDAGAP